MSAEYIAIHTYEECPGLCIKIMACNMDHSPTEEERMVLYKAVDSIVAAISKETLRLKPETARDAELERLRIINCFPTTAIYVEAIPNGYCSDWCCAFKPWFIVTTPVGRIKIGWRKRVINIDWSDSRITTTAYDLFEREEVTRGDRYIHAWGYDKARLYLKHIINNDPLLAATE